MKPLRPRAIEVSPPIWTREQNQLLRSSTDGALLQVIYSQKKISSDTGYSFLENIAKEMKPLRPRAIEVSAPIWTREQNQLL